MEEPLCGDVEVEWEWRRSGSQSILFHIGNVINALAWFLLSVPFIQFAWIQSQGGKRKIFAHASLAMMAIGGALVEMISRILTFGAYQTASWISTAFNLSSWGSSGDDMGWRALETCYIIIEGMLMWIDAFEWLALFWCLGMVYFSVITAKESTRVFSRWWARFGLLIAFFSMSDFSLDVLRWEDWQSATLLAMFVSFLNTIILLPLWLLWFGHQLSRAKTEMKNESDILFHTTVVA